MLNFYFIEHHLSDKGVYIFTENSIEEPYNGNETTLCMELVMVVDNSMYAFLDKSLDKVHKYCKDIVNNVNSVIYKSKMDGQERI